MTKRGGKGSDKLIAPLHLGLIPDGNRRWSKSNRLSLLNGYQTGIKKFVDFSIWAKGFGVKTLSVYALSTENIKKRSSMEVRALYSLYVRASKDPKLIALLLRNSARIKIIGDLAIVPEGVRAALRELERKTLMCKEFTINLLIGYGGREDLLYAIEHRGSSEEINEESFRKHMISSSLPDLDLIIRTSGEQRISGFLPWQSSYSEFYFAKKYWPDFSKSDLRKAIAAFSSRERRIGR